MPRSLPKRLVRKVIGRPLFRTEVNSALKGKQYYKDQIIETRSGLKRAHQTFRGDVAHAHEKHDRYVQTDRERTEGYIERMRDLNQKHAQAQLELNQSQEKRKSGRVGFLRWIFAGPTAKKKLAGLNKIKNK